MGGLVESPWLNYNKKDQFKSKSVFAGKGGGGVECVCWEGEVSKPVGMEGEKGRENIFLGITKCHSGEFQKLFK